MEIELEPIKDGERENFIVNIQAAFKRAAVEEFGELDGEVIQRAEIVDAFDAAGHETYNIVSGGKIIGGVILAIRPDTGRNELVLLFVNVGSQGKGVGQEVWRAVEKIHPETKVWETATPYFERRNIHFYVNKCGFRVVEFFNPRHPNPRIVDGEKIPPGVEYLFRFEKNMEQQ